jgi:hypothetical protein
MPHVLNELVNCGQLVLAGDGMYLAWMVPSVSDKEPNPQHGYVVSFIHLHKRSFTASVNRFMRGLCQCYIAGSFLRRRL